MNTPKKKDLVAIIKANPGCIATIDNDSWTLHRALPEGFMRWRDGAQGDWWGDPNNLLARADDEPFKWPKGKGDFASCCYGGDLLEALAIIAGMNVESV